MVMYLNNWYSAIIVPAIDYCICFISYMPRMFTLFNLRAVSPNIFFIRNIVIDSLKTNI